MGYISKSTLIPAPSSDTAAATLRAVIHFGKRGLTLRHLKVLLAVKVCLDHDTQPPTAKGIASECGLAPEEITTEITQLVHLHYLHEIIPLWGEIIPRYKLGAKGGTFVSKVLR